MTMPGSIAPITLALYALLLAVGGVMGFLKARSGHSLIAGLASATLALICLLIVELGRPVVGLGMGVALALILLGFFARRFTKNRRFMPGGLMSLVSLVVVVILAATLVRGNSEGG